MRRFVPRSLLGQVMVALAAALLIAQGISATLLYRAAEQRREAGLMHAAAFQLISGDRREERRARNGRGESRRVEEERRRFRPRFVRDGEGNSVRLPRSIRFSRSADDPLLAGEKHQPGREQAMRELLAAQGISVEAVAVTERALLHDPLVQQSVDRFPELRQRFSGEDHRMIVVGVRRAGESSWQVVRISQPQRDSFLLPGLVLQTLILFAVMVGLLYLVLRRITRPLDKLAERTRRFAGAGAPEPPLAPSGPDDVRRLIEAHNAMQARIGSMLDEKDVMLGAIGHDLKTPLAALRVRIEAVDDEVARARMAATIEDIARTLDEILALARVGRPDAAPERTELHALAASVVEEFEDMGGAVTMTGGERIAAPVRITWLKRGLRNLVANALRYAGSAEISVVLETGAAVLRVEDRGPGIPADRIAEMLEPFTRGEASRNRETGGSGLGLALARAVAEQHGGALVLANRPEGGLRAEIRVPL